MASIIDLPDFMFLGVNKKYNKFTKIYYTLYGLLVGYIHKNTNKKIFCFLMNIFFSKDGSIYYEDNFYKKILWDNSEFCYSNKRIDRVIVDHKKHFEILYKTYCLGEINFKKGDTVIDCGANVGELYVALKLFDKTIDYIAFEPDPHVFSTLQKNLSKFNQTLYEYALSDKNEEKSLFLNTDAADSSLIFFGSDSKTTVTTKTLDSFKYPQIKLLKIEAEGAELEVLKGSSDSLCNIEYISVDYGPERGVNNESTIVEIINFLYDTGFKLTNVSQYREVGLFKNMLF
jgi:FkbM family methyltransferase